MQVPLQLGVLYLKVHDGDCSPTFMECITACLCQGSYRCIRSAYRSWHGVGPDVDGALIGNVDKHFACFEVSGGHYTSEAVLVDSVHLYVVDLQERSQDLAFMIALLGNPLPPQVQLLPNCMISQGRAYGDSLLANSIKRFTVYPHGKRGAPLPHSPSTNQKGQRSRESARDQMR